MDNFQEDTLEIGHIIQCHYDTGPYATMTLNLILLEHTRHFVTRTHGMNSLSLMSWSAKWFDRPNHLVDISQNGLIEQMVWQTKSFGWYLSK